MSVVLGGGITCISCDVVFHDSDVQRAHYKTDWHRYNLKRKVAELPPVTSDEFRRRVLLQHNNLNAEKKNEYCTICKKHFNSSNVYINHLNSKKHKENLLVKEEDTEKSISPKKLVKEVDNSSAESCNNEDLDLDSDEWDEDSENPVEYDKCLFCLHPSRSLVENIKHMSLKHSFFIPDAEYCVDVKSLLIYLGEKIVSGHMCLWCSDKGKSFHTLQATQQHMMDKGHCKMLHEGDALLEYAEFYDYSSSYPDAANQDVDNEEEVKLEEIDGTDYQLVLPSGNVIGHRSLMHFYKQKLNPNPPKVPKHNKKIIEHYKGLGWTATKQEIAIRKARDIRYVTKLESKYRLKLNLKANKFQKHFRQQVNY